MGFASFADAECDPCATRPNVTSSSVINFFFDFSFIVICAIARAISVTKPHRIRYWTLRRVNGLTEEAVSPPLPSRQWFDRGFITTSLHSFITTSALRSCVKGGTARIPSNTKTETNKCIAFLWGLCSSNTNPRHVCDCDVRVECFFPCSFPFQKQNHSVHKMFSFENNKVAPSICNDWVLTA